MINLSAAGRLGAWMSTLARSAACLVATALIFVAAPASSEDRAAEDWTKLRPDSKVSGQMLCALSLYMLVQEMSAVCKFPRRPADDAIDRAIGEIENFMIANSSYHPTPSTFEGMRRGVADGIKKAPPQYACGGHDFDRFFSNAKPEAIDAGVKALLATPAKPGEITPCL